MTTTGDERPAWLDEVRREAGLRRVLVLYGNVLDRVFDPSERQYVDVAGLVLRALRSDRRLGFTMGVAWDRADGFLPADDESRRRFGEAQRRAVLGGDGGARGGDYDLGDGGAGSGQREAADSGGTLRHPREAFPLVRALLGQEGERPLVVLSCGQHLFGRADSLPEDERDWLLLLGKVAAGPPVAAVTSRSLDQPDGLVVVLTTSLGAIPPSLYQHEARVKLVAVPAPSRPERRAFFLRHADDLACAEPRAAGGAVAATAREARAEALADLTDGFSCTQLVQLLALSRKTDERLPPERLVNLYRFGDKRSPWEELGKDRLRDVDATLGGRVKGQEEAVRHAATMIIRAHMGLAGIQHSARRSKPKGTLFLVGPTGVGKTELAKAIASFLFGDEGACLRFDMSEYNHEHSDQRLVGAPPGYVGFEEGGQLTNAVRERPFSVLLFDEVEKAHGRVLDKFLQILEDGRLTDGRGETAHFSESVIIFTSNLGASSMAAASDTTPEAVRQHFLTAVERHFVETLGRPELLNRLGDNIVVFQPILDEGVRRAILERKLEPLRELMRDRWGMGLELAEGAEGHYLSVARREHGGRGLLNALERDLLNPLARFLFEREHQLRAGRRVVVSLAGAAPRFALEEG